MASKLKTRLFILRLYEDAKGRKVRNLTQVMSFVALTSCGRIRSFLPTGQLRLQPNLVPHVGFSFRVISEAPSTSPIWPLGLPMPTANWLGRPFGYTRAARCRDRGRKKHFSGVIKTSQVPTKFTETNSEASSLLMLCVHHHFSSALCFHLVPFL